MMYNVYAIFGTGAADRFFDYDVAKLADAVDYNGHIDVWSFTSKAAARAFVEGVEAAAGWMEAVCLSDLGGEGDLFKKAAKVYKRVQEM
jgi:hypothetical protein